MNAFLLSSNFKCDDSSHVSNLSLLVVVFTSSVVQVGGVGGETFSVHFFCVTWKRSFRQKTSTSNCFPFLRLPAQCFFLCYSSPGPRRTVHYWPWVAQCGKPNANSFVVVVSCCAAYLELRKLSGMNGGKIFFLRINFPFFIFHYRLCYATLSSRRWKAGRRCVNKSVGAFAQKKTNSTLVIYHRNKDFFSLNGLERYKWHIC